jgi:hypothetical protein
MSVGTERACLARATTLRCELVCPTCASLGLNAAFHTASLGRTAPTHPLRIACRGHSARATSLRWTFCPPTLAEMCPEGPPRGSTFSVPVFHLPQSCMRVSRICRASRNVGSKCISHHRMPLFWACQEVPMATPPCYAGSCLDRHGAGLPHCVAGNPTNEWFSDQVDDHRQLKTSLSTFSRGRFTTVRLRSWILPFPPFSESSIKTVLNQSAKNRDFFRQRNQTPHKRAQYRS